MEKQGERPGVWTKPLVEPVILQEEVCKLQDTESRSVWGGLGRWPATICKRIRFVPKPMEGRLESRTSL